MKWRYESDKTLTVRKLAEETGKSYGSVHRLLALAGTQMREWGGNTRRSKTGKARRQSVSFPDTANPRHADVYESLGVKPQRVFRGLAARKSTGVLAADARLPESRVNDHIEMMIALFGTRDQDGLVAVAQSLFPPMLARAMAQEGR